MSRVRNRLGHSLGAIALAAMVVCFAGGPAYADRGHHFGGTPDGPSSATITGSETTTHVVPGTPGSTGTSNSSGTSSSGGPVVATGPGTGSCNPALYPGGYSENFAVPAPCIQPPCTAIHPVTKSPVAVACDEPNATPAPPVITTEMVVDAAKVTAPTNPPHVEPGTVSYVNIPNNYWTDTNTVTDAVNILGQTIPLTWTPTGTTWNFGDGGTASGDGVEGAPMGAPEAIEHAYARQGSYDITTTTTYNLSFVLPGQGAQTIPLTSPPSPAVTLPIREIQTLVSFIR